MAVLVALAAIAAPYPPHVLRLDRGMTDNGAMIEYMTTPEVAAILKRPLSTVQWQAARGHLPVAMKLPGKSGAYLFDRAAIAALAAREAKK